MCISFESYKIQIQSNKNNLCLSIPPGTLDPGQILKIFSKPSPSKNHTWLEMVQMQVSVSEFVQALQNYQMLELQLAQVVSCLSCTVPTGRPHIDSVLLQVSKSTFLVLFYHLLVNTLKIQKVNGELYIKSWFSDGILRWPIW